ncbi:MAG: hypothetical protein WDN09_03310 [bacterium]
MTVSELTWSPHITRKNGIFYVTVGGIPWDILDWARRTECWAGSKAGKVLLSADFELGESASPSAIAIIPGSYFAGKNRMRVADVRKAATGTLGFRTPKAGLIAALYEQIGEDDMKMMGLTWIALMHEPVEIEDEIRLALLAIYPKRGKLLEVFPEKPNDEWTLEGGFAFQAEAFPGALPAIPHDSLDHRV